MSFFIVTDNIFIVILLVGAYGSESTSKLIKIEGEWTFEKLKGFKAPVPKWRKYLKSEKTQYPYKTTEEVIAESQNSRQRKKEFK